MNNNENSLKKKSSVLLCKFVGLIVILLISDGMKYQYRPPTQEPINPPYKEYLDRKKTASFTNSSGEVDQAFIDKFMLFHPDEQPTEGETK